MNLDSIRVASPCPVTWESMSGTNEVRFCSHCQLNVYNLSALSKTEAESLLSSHGNVCGRFFRRADGTILTQDCPVGLQAVRRRLSRMMTAIVGVAAGLCLPLMGRGQDRDSCTPQITIVRKELKDDTRTVFRGTVVDPNGAVIAGANIGITDTSTHKSSVRRTDDEGTFEFPELTPGKYVLLVEYPGFVSYSNGGFEIAPKEVTEINLILQLDGVTTIGLLALPPEPDPPAKRAFDLDRMKKLPLP